MTQNLRSFGYKKEQQVCQYLLGQGLKLHMQNYLCKGGEVDLIMQEQDILVFVEVRYRKGRSYGGAIESVTRKKQQKIIRAANHYLQVFGLLEKSICRFDVVIVEDDSNGCENIIWIKDAFWVKC